MVVTCAKCGTWMVIFDEGSTTNKCLSCLYEIKASATSEIVGRVVIEK